MSGYENFAVVGAGVTGNFIVRQLLKDKAARVISVDYLNKQPIKDARWGGYRCLYHLICSSWRARSIAEAAKEANVRLFIPSEFGVSSEESLTSFDAKTSVRSHLRALVSGPSYVPFYTADWVWKSFLDLNVTSGKVSVGGDSNKYISFTPRPDIARYVSYVLAHLPAEQLENHSFRLAGDTKSFKEVFKTHEAKGGRSLTYQFLSLTKDLPLILTILTPSRTRSFIPVA